jgi:predicted O-methyltransferase YrrM
MGKARKSASKGSHRNGMRSRFQGAIRVLKGDTAPVLRPTEVDDSVDTAIKTLAATPIREIQDRGYHFQLRDYYSGLNDIPFLVEHWDLWHDRPFPQGIDWDLDAQLEQVHQISPYFSELADVPLNAPPGPLRYYWNNDFWRGADAAVHYGLLRHRKPRRVVEIGCGWSSLLLADALKRNEDEGRQAATVDQVEPFPRMELLSALPTDWNLHEVLLQRAELALFESLGSGDFCFFDGSHVVRTGSDVVWFFSEVLPRLKPGVLIHVHDIFWPNDYPDEWIMERGQTWNEQFLLQAFLMYNDSYRPIVSNTALLHSRRSQLDVLYRDFPDAHSGVSFWFERVQ